jgi:hypothetical protein
MACKKETKIGDNYKFETIAYQDFIINVYKATYEDDKISVLELQGNPRTYYFYYNSKRQLIRKEVLRITKEKLADYKYNGNGQLVEEKNFMTLSLFDPIHKFTYEYSNGKRKQMNIYTWDNAISDYGYIGKYVYDWADDNVSSFSFYDRTDILVETYQLSYDQSKPNIFLSMFKDFYIQDLYDRKATHYHFLSKNQIVKISSVINGSRYPITYTYNSKNQIETISDNQFFPSPLWKFTYTNK